MSARARRRPRPKRRGKGLMRLLGLLLLLSIGALAWLLLVYPRSGNHRPTESVELEIAEGASVAEVVNQLAEAELVERPFVFSVYLRLRGVGKSLRHGTVLLGRGLSPEALAARLDDRREDHLVRVTLPEGIHRFDIAERLAAAGICDRDAFLEASLERRDGLPGTAEGMLFPDTYEFRRGSDPRRVSRRMQRVFEQRVEAVRERHAARLTELGETLGWTFQEVLTLASVVEKEAAVAVERRTIAGVFLNRLQSETFRPLQRLQADPTVSYGCIAEPDATPSCANFRGTITRAMLNDSGNRYNTYRHPGLPPTPICNPGLPSIEAVLDPEPHDYLYFVARGHGRHSFSATLEEHNEAVARYRAQQ